MRRPLRVAIAGVVGLAGLAIAVPALAATNQVIAETGGAEAQITLLGVPVTVSVELNTDTGDITAVNVTPPGDLVATKDAPSRVRFESANGQTSVSVKAKKDSLSIGARTASLRDLVGSNTWKSSVFGAGDGPSSVAYTIADDGSGGPVLTLGTITPGTGVTANSLGTTNGGGDDDEGMTASGSVEFTKDGFRKVLRRHRLRLPKERMEHCDYFTMEAGLAATARLLSRDRAVTALFCSNDMIALGAIKAVVDAGGVVPRDVSVVGFDDIFISPLMTPALTTVRQPIARIGEEAVALAIRLTQNPSLEPVQRILPVELVVRASTAPVPNGR